MHTKGRAWRMAGAWLLTLMLLALGFAAYYNVYVRGRRQYFTEKRMRDLQFLGDRFKLRIENMGNYVIRNAFAERELTGEEKYADCPEQPPNLELLLERLVPDFIDFNFASTAISSEEKVKLAVARKENKPVLLFTLDAPWEARGVQASIRLAVEANGFIEPYAEEEWFDQLSVADNDGKVLFHQGQLIVSNFKYLFGRSAKPDQQPAATDAKAKKPDEQPADTEWEAAGAASGVWEKTITGEEHLVFVQPVEILFSASTGPEVSWRVIGLVRSSRVTRESYAISFTVIIIFIFLVLIAVAAWPFLKVLTLGPHDRLARYDVIAVFVAAVLTAALAAFFAVDTYSYNNLAQRLDLQLQRLAANIRERFNDDLEVLLLVARALGELPSPEEGRHCNVAAGLHAPEDAAGVVSGKSRGKISAGETDPYARTLQNALLRGAFFQSVAWIDGEGNQKHKRTTGTFTTPMVNLAEPKKRDYFQKVRDGEMWTAELAGLGKRGPEDRPSASFWLEPLVSQTTGKSLATFSAAALPPEGSVVSPTELRARNGHTWVVALDVELPSLRGAHVLLAKENEARDELLEENVRKVVLPPGYGFAVLQENGSVLFHSDEARHLQEDFLVEADHDSELRAIILGRASEPFSGRYLGADHRFYVTRLRSQPGGPPWVLVVFHNKMLMRTANLEALSQALILYGWMFTSILPVFLIFWMGEKQTGWLWPDETRLSQYQGLLPRLLAIAIFFAFAVWLFSPPTLAYASFVAPPAVLLATRWKFKDGRFKGWWLILAAVLHAVIAVIWLTPFSGKALLFGLLVVGVLFIIFLLPWTDRVVEALARGKPWSGLTLKSAYLWTVAALLIIVGVLPAIAFFRIAWERELNLYVRHGQLGLAQLLDARRQGLTAKFRDIKGGPTLKSLWEETSRDVYKEFFFPCEHTPKEPQTTAAKTAVSTEPLNDGQDLIPYVPDPSESRLDSILEFSRPLFNKTAIENHELLHNGAADKTFSWRQDGSGCLLLNTAGVALLQLAARVPAPWRPVTLRTGVFAVLLAIGLSLIIWRIAIVIARQIFLVDRDLPAAAGTPPADSYKEIWENCTDEEKLALYDLAKDNFVNRNNPAILDLMRQGLILHPSLRLHDPGFKNFVERAGARKDAFPSLAADAPSLWQMLKWPLGIVLIAAASFLFLSQRHVFDTSLGFIGALVTGLTAVYKLLDVLRGPGRPS